VTRHASRRRAREETVWFPDHFVTQRLLLRPIEWDDAPAIFSGYAQDQEVTRYLTWTPHRTIDDTHGYIGACIAEARRGGKTYVIVSQSTGQVAGAFEVRKPEPHRLAFGYVLARPLWGQGLMTEALAEVVAWGMRQDGIWRIESLCDTENLASARVMEKVDLRREGILRRCLIHPNISPDPRDCFSYARTR
jgi:RimJ/RimL family protein N-acetyltransferase